MGLAQCRAWCDLSVRLAVSSRGSFVTWPTQVATRRSSSSSRHDPSIREALGGLSRTVGLRAEAFRINANKTYV